MTGVQLAPGVWLRIEAPTDQIAQVVADAVRLDRAQRCVLPFQLTSRPNNAAATTCYVSFIRPAVGLDGATYPAAFAQGGVILEDSDGSTMEVNAGPGPFNVVRVPNHMIDGRTAYLLPSLDEIELLAMPIEIRARIGKAYRGFAVADADVALGGLIVAADPQRMATWPGRLVAG